MKEIIQNFIKKIKNNSKNNKIIKDILNEEEKELLQKKLGEEEKKKFPICLKIWEKIKSNLENYPNDLMKNIYNIKSNFIKKIFMKFDEFEKNLKENYMFDYYSFQDIIEKRYNFTKKSPIKLNKIDSFIFQGLFT
jgi:hypothetical protein